MKILHVTSHLNVGGIPRYVLSLSERQARMGHTVFIASADGRQDSRCVTMGVGHWRVPFDTSADFSPQVFRGMMQLVEHLRGEPVDILHAHTRVGQVAAAGLSRRLRIPYVTTWHGIYRSNLGRKLWPCMGERTIAISGPVRDHLVENFGVPSERVRLVYNGIDADFYAAGVDAAAIDAYRKEWKIPAGCPVIGAIGRLAAGRVKGFDLLLMAAVFLQDAVPDFKILIVGDGPRRPFLEDVARRLKIHHRIQFVGTSQDIRVPLAVMDIFVFTSRWPEAFGLTLVEAMAASKPVVATRIGAVPEIVRDGLDGFLVPPEDPIALAQAITRFIQNADQARRMGHQAQERAREAFNLDRMTREVEAVYQELIR